MAIASNIQDLVKELTPATDTKAKTYTAEVSHTDEEGIVWVRLPGAEQDTPTASTSTDVKMGDTVTVEWRNNKLYVAGNYTNPSAGVERVAKVGRNAQAGIEKVQKTADDALAKANKQMQYFWTDADGAHVTTVPKETFSENQTGGNALFDSDSVEFKDGDTSLAKFGANGARVGKTSGAHTNIGASGMQVYKDATTQLANIGYGEGNAQTGTANAPFYSLGVRRGSNAADIGNYSMSEGYGTKASGAYSHAEGNGSEASGANSHAEGYCTEANGNWSHAEGYESTASSDYSHAEGFSTTVSGSYSHAEGFRTTASGSTAHAEGSGTTASGNGSHAEGIGTTASGWISHASGQNTIAGYQKQTVIGKFNDNKQNNAFEIGNGVADDARSNAFEVDWNGNTTAAGTITVEGHSSQIGDIRARGMGSDTVVHTATGTALCALTLPAGTWSLVGFVRFPSNNTGVRRANISTDRASNALQMQLSPTQGGVTQFQVCHVVAVTATTTYYLNVYHTAGVDLTLPAGTSEGYINGIRAARIA